MPLAPKSHPVRRNARVGPLQLPSEGRRGKTPRWPLPGKPSAIEAAAWRELWSAPQAAAWEVMGCARIVARYARVMVRAESTEVTAAILAQAVVLEDRLGLSPRSMRMLLWEIAPDQVSERRVSSSSRRVLPKAVQPLGTDDGQ